jgi:hypothetical protein
MLGQASRASSAAAKAVIENQKRKARVRWPILKDAAIDWR